MKGKRFISSVLAVMTFWLSSGASALPVPVLALGDGDGETEEYTLGSSLNDVVSIDEENFPDETFRSYVSENFDTDKSGGLSQEELDVVTEIDVSGSWETKGNLAGLKGIENFTKLKSLYCYNNQLTSLDISENTALEYLKCHNNQITSLDVSNNSSLKELWCSDNQIKNIDVSKCDDLYQLYCYNNQFTCLDVGKNIRLDSLYCGGNQLTSLDVSKNTALRYLSIGFNQIESLDVRNNTNLMVLRCSENRLTSLDVSQNTGLIELYCDNNKLSCIDVSNNNTLLYLKCNNNRLTSLDVSKNTNLATLDCDCNQLTSLDVSNNTKLSGNWINCKNNSYSIGDVKDSYSLDSLPAGFDPKKASNWQGADYDESTNSLINFTYDTVTYDYDCGNGKTVTFTLTADSVSQPDTVLINEESFPDETFRNYVLNNFDTDKSGGLSQAELDAVTKINVSGSAEQWGTVSDLTGIGYFKNLTSLNFQFNNVSDIDLSGNTALQTLICDHNKFTELDISANTKLQLLWCGENSLTALDVSNNTALKNLVCPFNQIISLDVSQNSDLEWLDCGNNKLSDLKISGNSALKTLYCFGNQLTSLDVSSNDALTQLHFDNNRITSIDVSNNTALEILNCSKNQLTSLDLSNNTALTGLTYDNNNYSIGDVSGSFSLDKLPAGFDPKKASNWQGAEYDESTNSLINFTSDTVTYDYDCGNGHSITFTLVKTGGHSMNITKQPENTAVIEGLDASFSVTAEGEDITYQWQMLTGESWADISGETSSVLKLNNVTYDLNGTEYRCVVTAADESVTSGEAVITVKAAEQVTVSEVEAMSIDEVIKFVNAFSARYDKAGKDTAVLTSAQMTAIERVLENDYKG